MRRTIFTILTLLLAATLSAQTAQVAPMPAGVSNDARNRISELLARGDTAGAQKVLAEATANMKAPPPGAAVPAWNTFFEEIRACGFYPQESRLECVIDIKQQGGYGGPVGSPGSFEYVAFFVDCAGDGFQTWDYVGSGIVNVTDGSAKTNFAVYRDFNPPGGQRTNNGGATSTTTTNGPICRALAKLSWFNPSITPGQFVPWGNELNFNIRYLPIR